MELQLPTLINYNAIYRRLLRNVKQYAWMWSRARPSCDFQLEQYRFFKFFEFCLSVEYIPIIVSDLIYLVLIAQVFPLQVATVINSDLIATFNWTHFIMFDNYANKLSFFICFRLLTRPWSNDKFLIFNWRSGTPRQCTLRRSPGLTFKTRRTAAFYIRAGGHIPHFSDSYYYYILMA